MESNRDGTAAVVHGALVVTPPEGAGRPAVVRCEAGIELHAPDEVCSPGPVELTAASDVDVRLPDDLPRLDVHVELSRDALLATMTVERVPGARYRLEDQPPNQSIVLRRLVADRIPCPDLTRERLQEQLEHHGVRFGIAEDALGRLVRGGFGPETVAKGIAPVRPRDGQLQLHGLETRGERFVRAGALLAQISEPLAGTEGRTVLGQSLPVDEPQPVGLQVGEGASQTGDGRVVAAIDGHATVVDGTIQVLSALVVDGDVHSSQGEVSSLGSLKVVGSIEEGSLVRAKRSITVGDAIRRATVEAGCSLEVGGAAFDSTIRTGHIWAALDGLQRATAPLAQDVGRVAAGVGQLIEATRAAGRELHPVRALAMVLERIEPELEAKIRGALAEADRQRGAVPFEMLAALRSAQEDLDAIRSGRRPIDGLALVAGTFAEQAKRLVELTATRPHFSALLLQKCEVSAVGSVEVHGKGIVDSTLTIVGTLAVSATDAIFRGGHLDLDGSAVVQQLAPGASGGLTIVLAPGSMLQAAVVNPGVIVHLPTGTRRFTTPETNVRISAPRAVAA